MAWRDSPYWNIVLLALAWALTLSTSTLLTTVGPLSAKNLGLSDSLAAFTIGIFLIGAALSSVPSGWLFRKFGRFWGFTLGCFFQFIGSFLGTIALWSNQSTWLFLGCLSIGLAQGLGQFYRFSAVEITPPELKTRAVTYVLSGGIIAAFLGPTSASLSAHLVGEEYMGSYLAIAVFAILNQLVVYMVNFPPPPGRDVKEGPSISIISTSNLEQEEKIRTTCEIISQPNFILACTIATLAHTIMVMVMSNVTVDMKDHDYSIATASIVMELHFFAMFSPGFVSGKMIERYGPFLVALIGGTIFAGSSVILAADHQLYNFILGMILVGVAWNLSFSAGTVMLTTCYKPKEATEVQAANDFILFSVAGAGSLASGYVYSYYGWDILIYVVSVLMAIYMLLFISALQKPPPDSPSAKRALSKQDSLNRPFLSETSQPMDYHDSDFTQLNDSAMTAYDSNRRGASFSDVVQNISSKISFSMRAEDFIQGNDELTPLRSMSVA